MHRQGQAFWKISPRVVVGYHSQMVVGMLWSGGKGPSEAAGTAAAAPVEVVCHAEDVVLPHAYAGVLRSWRRDG